MSDTIFSSRVRTRNGNTVIIPCDDGTGGELHVLRAPDGDLHFSMHFNARHPNADDIYQGDGTGYALACGMANVRVRSGIGGGSNPELWLALAKIVNTLLPAPPAEGGE